MSTIRVFAVIACGGAVACAQGPATAASSTDWPALDKAATAFVGVNVVTMGAAGTLRNQTVIVRDGRIAAVGPAASTKVPAGTTPSTPRPSPRAGPITARRGRGRSITRATTGPSCSIRTVTTSRR
jgi:hypothetical protein